MDKKRFFSLAKRNFIFYLSRKLDYPLIAADTLQINFTFRCNLRCRMCSMHDRMESLKAENRPYELDIPTIKKVIKEASEMGVHSLILIGGEPFLEPRLFEVVSFAKLCGIDGVTVVTNGTLFSSEIIEKMFESNLSNLSVSIDAASEDTVSKIRGENVLTKMIENINLINSMKEKTNRHSPSMVSVCTIMDQNLEELEDVINLCRQLKICRIIFQPVVGNNTDQARADFSSSVFIPENRYDILDKAVDELIRYKLASKDNFAFIANDVRHLKLIKKYFRGKLKAQGIPCYAGYNRIQVVQEGKIYFCVNQDKYESTFGDVSTDSLEKLWFSRKATSYRRLIRKCDFPCLQWCAYRDEFIELSDAFKNYFLNKNFHD